MDWIFDYQFFLFDFDGLLADTESIHYQAYIEMCAQRGYTLNWSFARYSESAHHSSTGLRDGIYAEFPSLKEEEPNWASLYAEKQRLFLDFIQQQPVPLMPGVAELLQALKKAHIPSCVVTNSMRSVTHTIREKNPILNTIPYWITREDYTLPKPHPECYQIAIDKFSPSKTGVVGFEDSPKGLEALAQTQAQPFLICPPYLAYIEQTLKKHPQTLYYPTFFDVQNRQAP